jgi:hypothetical protein
LDDAIKLGADPKDPMLSQAANILREEQRRIEIIDWRRRLKNLVVAPDTVADEFQQLFSTLPK